LRGSGDAGSTRCAVCLKALPEFAEMPAMTGQMDILGGAVEHANPGLAELDSEECFVALNPAFLSVLGQSEAELLGRHWSLTVHPEDHSRTREAYAEARSTGRGYVEIRAVRADSTISHQAITITREETEGGGFGGYRCAQKGIPEPRQEQTALVVAVDSSPNGSFLINATGQICAANRVVEMLFGYQRGELIGRPVEMLLPAGFEDSPAKSHEYAGWDLSGRRKDGVEIPVQVYLKRIETPAGQVTLCAIIDISQRVGHEHQLELSKQAAEAASRAKSDFLARMSHEIRTPMNLIMGMNALLLESPLNETQRQHVEISYRNLRRLLRLINGILDLSKVEAGGLTLERNPLDLNEVLAECEATMTSAIAKKGLQFRMSIDPDASRYWIGDPERLQQVLMNLIGNSVKFTSQGKIELAVRRATGSRGEEGLRFEVSDTGCGVPPDKSEVIFEAFQQAEGGMGRPFEGSGLGLAIARTLVTLMSGRIWLEQQPDAGSKFVFTAFFTPAAQNAVQSKVAVAPAAVAARRLDPGIRVLLVEDNSENMILLQAYLENLSLSLDFASNGMEALEKRQQRDYDLVLMDIQMPVMDGYTATREIRSWESGKGLPGVPIVALTAHALSGARRESMEAGCAEHLTKPVDRKDLIEAIAKFSKRPAAQVEIIPDPLPEGIEALRPSYLAKRLLDLARLRDALGAGDFATIQSIGHNCKGTGRGYGFPEISSAGAAVERAARALDADGVAESIHQFERSIRVSEPFGLSAGVAS